MGYVSEICQLFSDKVDGSQKKTDQLVYILD